MRLALAYNTNKNEQLHFQVLWEFCFCKFFGGAFSPDIIAPKNVKFMNFQWEES